MDLQPGARQTHLRGPARPGIPRRPGNPHLRPLSRPRSVHRLQDGYPAAHGPHVGAVVAPCHRRGHPGTPAAGGTSAGRASGHAP
eukprot:15470710-Alexandrium_andersonii.AAC.1